MARTGLVYSLGKSIAPTLSRLSSRTQYLRKILGMVEEYTAVLQGRGAGTGWDLKSEVMAALPFIQKPDAVVFDVGANIGEWSQLLLDELDFTPRLYLFEPLAACQKIIQALNLPQANLIHAAVGKEQGSLTLYHPPEDTSTLASLYKRRDFSLDEREVVEEQVDVLTIDDYVNAHNIEQIDFLKIDVEGHELSVLQGAETMLKSGKIRSLLFEFGSPHINSRTFFIDFWDFLHPAGYTISRICPGNVLQVIDHYHEDLEYFKNTSNYLAVYNP